MEMSQIHLSEKTNNQNMKPKTLVNEFSQKEKNSGEEIKFIFGIQNNYIKMMIREGIDIYLCQLSLNQLSTQNKYFRLFDTIEEAYNDLLLIFSTNKYEIKAEDNTITISVEIEYSYKKYIVPFVLEKLGTKKEEKKESEYMTDNYNTNNNIDNSLLKELNNKVNKLEEKLNSFEDKINLIYEYINDKKIKKEKEDDEKAQFAFDYILRKSKIIKNEQILLLKEWLPFDKNKIRCKLLYHARRDGDDASTFHSLCDNKESTLTVISTSDNKIIGGFLSKPFGGNKYLISDNKAFLFSLNYNEKYPSLNRGNNYVDRNDMGPIFGYYCIYINDKFFSSKGNYYNPNRVRYDFGDRSQDKSTFFQVVDLEIYQIFEL